AQRRVVRRTAMELFAPRSRILEIGGGTGTDAAWLAAGGHVLTSTDPSPAMVALARAKLAPFGGRAEILAAEDIEAFSARHGESFDAVFSNFAALNCVENLAPLGPGLARLVRPGGIALLVLFGTLCPGEMLTELLRARPNSALRRRKLGAVPARLGGKDFKVVYHRETDLVRALSPHFTLERRLGVGVFVPPSAAEPWISRHRRLLRGMERLDSAFGRILALLGDHVLYVFRRVS